MTPQLSIVLAVHGGVERLPSVLDALAPQLRPAVELLVCAGADWERAKELCAERTALSLVRGAADDLTPHLWRDGILAAHAPRVALGVVHQIPAPDWVDRLLAVDLEHYCAVGGALDIAPDADGCGWASYLLRYTPYAPGGTEREVADVPGDNAVYDRDALLAHREAFADGFWEPEIHGLLLGEGRRILFDPALLVVHHNGYRPRELARQRFQHGTRFGYDRGARLPRGKRILYAAAAPAAPLMLGVKVLRRSWQRPELRRHLWRALPALCLFLLAWGAGETRGALAAAGLGKAPGGAR